jgi:glyoxylase-like metal-dependent hydrolase (beta-lactamase superfamily II)/rhodanese-related sulfurtransferase
MMEIQAFTTAGLGDNSYLIASGDEAAVVDPQRDGWRFVEVAESHGWRIRHVLETHVHNDYVSGAIELREATGAEIVAPARGGYAFPHRAAEAGDEVALGTLRIVALPSPGHTPEHTSWVVRRTNEAGVGVDTAIFTGGSLLVGSAGRTDLLGETMTEELTRAQYRTLRALVDPGAYPDDVRVWPTHGAGSFCVSARSSAERTSTIGQERAANAALAVSDEDAFVRQQLSGLMAYPAYYRYMAPINRAGPALLGGLPPLQQITGQELAALIDDGVHVVDARDRVLFAAAHIPGSLNIELNESLASYVGWVVPFGERIVLVLPDPIKESAEEAMSQLIRVGFDRIEGALAGGVDAWTAAGRPTSTYPTTTMKELLAEWRHAPDDVPILDVRQPAEWRDDGAIPGSLRAFVGDLPGQLSDLPRERRLSVLCTSGHRAALAASLLDAEGIPVRLVARGGAVGWVERFARS